MKKKLLCTLTLGVVLYCITGCGITKKVDKVAGDLNSKIDKIANRTPDYQKILGFDVISMKDEMVSHYRFQAIIVDKETRVMYYYQRLPNSAITLTPLLDSNGKPKLYKGKLNK